MLVYCQPMTKKLVEKMLKTVNDPELGINIVELGLIYEITIKDQKEVRIKMTMTTPGCPLGGWFIEQIREAVGTGLAIDTDDVIVEMVFDPPWSQELMTDEAKEKLGLL